MYTYKVQIHPNNKQETRIRRTLNKCIECNNIVYDYIEDYRNKHDKRIPKLKEVRKWFSMQKSILDKETIEKRKNMTKRQMREEHLDTLFYDVSNDALKLEINTLYNSYIRFFKKLSGYPKRKEYKFYRKSFYVDSYKVEFTDRKVKLEKISKTKKKNRLKLNWVSLAEKDRIPTDVSYSNVRVVMEGNRFYIVASVDDIFGPKKKIQVDKDKKIGIDVNIKSIVTSENVYYQSITAAANYKKTKKLYKRAQRKLSRRYQVATNEKRKLRDCKNYIKQRIKVNKYIRKLTNIRLAHIVDTSLSIINSKPSVIGIETLKVKEMMERKKKEKEERKLNYEKAKQEMSKEDFEKYKKKLQEERKRHNIASRIQENPFAKFINALSYMAESRGIVVMKASQWYASSKTCNKCKYIKEDLKLSDRIFNCPCCGLVIDRDYNAAINLKNYTLNIKV